MLVFIKLGGSLITDKRVERSYREAIANRLAMEISAALRTNPELKILIGHGSGSFGHFAAARFQTAQGVQTPEEWRAFAEVATVAAELNYLIAGSLHAAQIPVWRMQPSASALSHDGEITQLSVNPIRSALEHNLVPLVYGDVSLDDVRGGTIISTEKIFFYLAQHLPVRQILLVGEVQGVLDSDGHVIPEITLDNIADIEQALGGSAGVDVTGGMETKVRDMLSLIQIRPSMTIRIMDGTHVGLLEKTLIGAATPGTILHRV